MMQEYLFSGVNEGDMADHTPPLESGQLLSPELPILASPPPAMVNGEGPQQGILEGTASDCLKLSLHTSACAISCSETVLSG
ncbi:hypothetical protein PAMP_018301 [Pampus punctatissimus]